MLAEQSNTAESVTRSFVITLQARGLSPRSIGIYREAMKAFTNVFPNRDLAGVTREDVRLALSNPRWSGSTRLLRWKGLRAFFGFCLAEGLIAISPMQGIERPKGAKNARRPPSYTEGNVQELLQACPGWTWLGLRDQAIIMTLWTTPARIGEICGLQVDDVDWDRGLLQLRGKGGCEYKAVLFPELARALDRYLRNRPSQMDSLFITAAGAPMKTHTLQLMLRRLKNRTGSDLPLNAHMFRHLYGIRTVEWGLATDEAAAAMGHRSDKATQLYRQWVTQDQVLDKVRRLGSAKRV